MSVSRVSKWVLTRIDRFDTKCKETPREIGPQDKCSELPGAAADPDIASVPEQYLVPRFLLMDVKILLNPSRVAEKPVMPNKSVNQR